jgi:hypothetical protein
LITSIKRSSRFLNSGEKLKKLRQDVMHEKEANNQDPSYAEQQIEELKQIVKEQARTIRQNGHMLPNRPEFPIRFVAKPFVHYGNTAKVAANKRKEMDEIVKANDNRMKIYIALLQKEKNSEKPTIESINNERRSPKSYNRVESQKSIDISDDISRVNIEARSRLNSQDTEFKDKTPIKQTILSQNHEPSCLLPSLHYAQDNSPKKCNDSLLNFQSMLHEMSVMNKTVIDKNSEHASKHHIINSIRKFDDRC